MMSFEDLETISEYWRVPQFRDLIGAISVDLRQRYIEAAQKDIVSNNQHSAAMNAGKAEAYASLSHEFNQYSERLTQTLQRIRQQ